MWDDHLALVLSSKSTEVMQEACQVLEKHGHPMKEKLKSELHYILAPLTLQVVLQVLHYSHFILAHTCTKCMEYFIVLSTICLRKQ